MLIGHASAHDASHMSVMQQDTNVILLRMGQWLALVSLRGCRY